MRLAVHTAGCARIEASFDWLKMIALMRKVLHRGIHKVDWVFRFDAAAYDVLRMRICWPARLEPCEPGEKCPRTRPERAIEPQLHVLMHLKCRGCPS